MAHSGCPQRRWSSADFRQPPSRKQRSTLAPKAGPGYSARRQVSRFENRGETGSR